jgi:cytochrome c peroxidase
VIRTYPAALTFATCVFGCALTISTSSDGRLSALPPQAAVPASNPTSPARVALGRLLFWDPILSGNGDVACATCHHPDFAYTDGRDLALGTKAAGLGPLRAGVAGESVRPVRRNSQTLLNVAFNGLTIDRVDDPAKAPMFWDVRVRSLEAQALEPIKAQDEMRGDAYPEAGAVSAAVARIAENAEYRRLFADAFGTTKAVNAVNLGRALAVFERTLVAPNAPFDRYMRGDTDAMTAEQIRGMERFEATGCINCHNGPMLSDFTPHVLGVPDNAQLQVSDSGSGDSYGFRTPSLRNVGLTAPYMHNGVLTSLDDVVDFYRRVSRGRGRGRGGRFQQRTQNSNVTPADLDPLLRQLNMRGRGQREIVAFLGALDDPAFDRTIPARVPSGLSVGGRLAR